MSARPKTAISAPYSTTDIAQALRSVVGWTQCHGLLLPGATTS